MPTIQQKPVIWRFTSNVLENSKASRVGRRIYVARLWRLGKEEQAGRRALPVPGCGVRRRILANSPESCSGDNSLLLEMVQILPRIKRKISANPQGVC